MFDLSNDAVSTARPMQRLASYPQVADTYDVVVESPTHAEAARILDVSSSRPLDPPPANP